MKYLTLLIVFLLAVSCTEENYVPKPPTYLRLELPDHTYESYTDHCPYELSVHEMFTVKKVSNEQGLTCHRDIDLGPLNGSIHLSYIEMEEPLSTYVNFVNDKIDEHKVKATGIVDQRILNKDNNVYCTFFELQGDVASPFQFYLTDSVDRFVSGVVYFNSTPNYDSLKPSLDYLKLDLEHLINHFKWIE